MSRTDPRGFLPASALASACLLLPGAVALSGCAQALKAPPTLDALAGPASPGDPTDPAALIAEAKTLFARREIAAAQRGASLALRAAAATTPPTPEAVLLAIRTLVWIAEHEETSEARERAAIRAVQSAQWCDAAGSPAPCAYWKAAALGQQARERPSTGLSAVPLVEAGFREAAAADASLEHGGPDRALALLYLRAPGWPAGPGDPDKGLEHARRAIALDDAYPPNHLALAEALAKTGDDGAARRAYARARALALRADEAGDPDAGDWMREADEAIRAAPGAITGR